MPLISYSFPLFLLILLILYYLGPRKAQGIILLLGSFLFYLGSGPLGLLFLMFAIFSTYFLAIQMGKERAKSQELIKERGLKGKEKREAEAPYRARIRLFLILGLFLNFGMLVFLKYRFFILENLALLFSIPDIQTGMDGNTLFSVLFGSGLLLPLGISYYTFQSSAYLIDISKAKMTPERNLFRYALFVCFFPQITQGPISRYEELMPQLSEPHAFQRDNVESGLFRMLFGYAKKMLIADRVSVLVAALSENPSQYCGVYILLSILSYTLFMYADFTGGIDIVLGAAKLFGIRLPENFDHPFFSRSLGDFWRRWHMSLMRWFREYLFFPLSMSKVSKCLSSFFRKHFGNAAARRVPLYFSSFLVWFCTGFWHGASWGFILWGLSNCVVLLLSQELSPLFQRFRKRFPWTESHGYHAFEMLRTLLIFSLLEMFEYYPIRSIPGLWGSLFFSFRIFELLNGSFPSGIMKGPEWILLLLSTACLVATGFLSQKKSLEERFLEKSQEGRLAILGILFLCVLVFGVYGQGYEASQFVYNQF